MSPAPMWDARGHAGRLKLAAKSAGGSVSVLHGMVLLFEHDETPYLRAQFGNRGAIMKSTIRAVVGRHAPTPRSLVEVGDTFAFVSSMFSRTEWSAAETTRQLEAWITAGHPVEWEAIETRDVARWRETEERMRAVREAAASAPVGDDLAPVIPMRLRVSGPGS